MPTINERLNILANTTEAVESNLSAAQLEEERKKISIIDYKMVTFSLAGKDYAIDIMKVKEIAKAGRFTYVPNALPFVLGVYNLRGDIIPIIDLRLFFNISVPARDENALENMLIVTVGEQTFGVVVDAIDKVIGIQKSTIQPPHPLFGDINIKYIYGVAEAERRLYILLDIDKIFGVRTPEEEQELLETAKAQAERREAAAREAAEQAERVEAAAKQGDETAKAALAAAEAQKQVLEDIGFIADSLKNFKKFIVNDVTDEWTKKRYAEWSKERGATNTQLQSEADADIFLRPFFSKCNGTWWTESYANAVEKALPDNAANNIVVWNPGCGKGYESYSLACVLKKRYPNAHIRIYGQDVDLLSVSNAPLLNLSDEASNDWYQRYTTKTASGDYTFSKEIKDMVMFEYHDCVNTNSLPPLDIIFARDVLAFLPEQSQKTVLTEFNEKMKGNGVIIVGENERINIPGWNRKQNADVSIYTK